MPTFSPRATCLPRSTPNSLARPRIRAFCPHHPRVFARRYAQVLGKLEAMTGKRLERIHIVGGGSQNRLLNQLTADACRVPVVAGPVEATAIGNILMQMVALGTLSSLAEGRKLVAESFPLETFNPR
ncbi:MAG: FGGY-family carbohydrate kinase [Fimbriimonadales bacterium]